MEISDKWFDVIEPRKRTVIILTDQGLIIKELDVYELVVDRERKHCWITVSGLQAQQVLKIKGIPLEDFVILPSTIKEQKDKNK